MMCQQHRTNLRELDLSCGDTADPSDRRIDSRCNVERSRPYCPKRPSAGNRSADTVIRATMLVIDMVIRAKQIPDLIVMIGHHRLLKDSDVGLKLAQPVDQHTAAVFPRAVMSPQIKRHDSHSHPPCRDSR